MSYLANSHAASVWAAHRARLHAARGRGRDAPTGPRAVAAPRGKGRADRRPHGGPLGVAIHPEPAPRPDAPAA